jgi:Glutathione S-transferase, N-terminal domain
MLELYHTVNSVCAQKIRIQLEEKGLPWVSRLMTLRGDQFEPSYLKLNPNAVVPTLVHDGFRVIESSVILYYLEECFPEPSLMPASHRARVAVRVFNKIIDESVHNACTILTFATALRPRFRRMKAAIFQIPGTSPIRATADCVITGPMSRARSVRSLTGTDVRPGMALSCSWGSCQRRWPPLACHVT